MSRLPAQTSKIENIQETVYNIQTPARSGRFPVMVFPCFSVIFPVFRLTFRMSCGRGISDVVLLVVVFGYVWLCDVPLLRGVVGYVV